jgi:hypothetical protein
MFQINNQQKLQPTRELLSKSPEKTVYQTTQHGTQASESNGEKMYQCY